MGTRVDFGCHLPSCQPVSPLPGSSGLCLPLHVGIHCYMQAICIFSLHFLAGWSYHSHASLSYVKMTFVSPPLNHVPLRPGLQFHVDFPHPYPKGHSYSDLLNFPCFGWQAPQGAAWPSTWPMPINMALLINCLKQPVDLPHSISLRSALFFLFSPPLTQLRFTLFLTWITAIGY